MELQLTASDVFILSAAAACAVAAAILEMLRIVIPDIYEWVADHAKIRREIKDAKQALDRQLSANQTAAAQRDRRNAERFRLKSQLSRLEMVVKAAQKEKVEVWHELGTQSVADSLFTAKVANRLLADQSNREFDSAPVIWRFNNSVRVWAPSDRAARQMLGSAFPATDGYVVQEVIMAIDARTAGRR